MQSNAAEHGSQRPLWNPCAPELDVGGSLEDYEGRTEQQKK